MAAMEYVVPKRVLKQLSPIIGCFEREALPMMARRGVQPCYQKKKKKECTNAVTPLLFAEYAGPGTKSRGGCKWFGEQRDVHQD